MSERDHPPLEVLCSCGKTTALRWNGEKWRADDPMWTYAGGMCETLWSCGSPGHWQRNVRSPREPEAAFAMSIIGQTCPVCRGRGTMPRMASEEGGSALASGDRRTASSRARMASPSSEEPCRTCHGSGAIFLRMEECGEWQAAPTQSPLIGIDLTDLDQR